MKKLITIVTVVVVSLNFVSCRQEEDSSDFAINSNSQQKSSFRKVGDTAKTDSIKSNQKLIESDPPVKDGTRW